MFDAYSKQGILLYDGILENLHYVDLFFWQLNRSCVIRVLTASLLKWFHIYFARNVGKLSTKLNRYIVSSHKLAKVCCQRILFWDSNMTLMFFPLSIYVKICAKSLC